jgi:hypothetical protein
MRLRRRGAVAMPESVSGHDLHDRLTRWTAEGLIDAGQAARIAAAEAARTKSPSSAVSPDQPATEGPVPEPAARRTPLAAEALGYLGGTLTIVAGFSVIPMLWPGIPTSAELALAAVAATAFWGAGAVLRTGGEPAFRRLRTVLWLTSTASLAAFVGLIAAQIWDLGAISAGLVTAAITTVYAVALWWRTRAALQHLAMFAGTAVVAGTGIASLAPSAGAWGPGLAIWVVSALWGTAAYRGYLVPVTAGYIAAGIGLLTGAQMTMQTAAGHALALATVAGLLAAGVALRRVLLLGFGAVGIIAMVPQTAVRYLPTSAGAPLAVFVVGLSLLGLALWLAKSRKSPPPG